jgi:hypothetical protein
MTRADIIRMARQSRIDVYGLGVDYAKFDAALERFAALVAAHEREACANLVFHSPPSDEYESPLKAVYDAIRARGNT